MLGAGGPLRTDGWGHHQSFRFDWLGNTARTEDDDGGFYDRSLGAIQNGTADAGPYQLRAASNAGASPRDGALRGSYDAAGNLKRLDVDRNGQCRPAGAGCAQSFEYEWDEVGRLGRARRWDYGSLDVNTPAANTGTPAAELAFAYDAGDQRVLKSAKDAAGGPDRHTVYVYAGFELRRAVFNATDAAYEVSGRTVAAYLHANGVRLGRLEYEEPAPFVGGGQTHVFLEMGDHLGSTSIVIDRGTGELVERGTYQAFGGADTDYRPGKWQEFREDYRFTGKEEDVEVGLTYFGKRYYAPLLGRWVSADPLEVHSAGEASANLYAYVDGAALRNIDPLGLEDAPVERMLVFKEAESFTDTALQYTQDFGEGWKAKKPTDRDVYKIRSDKGPGRTPSGMQHLKALGSMAEQGKVKGRSQHLVLFTHGKVGLDEAGKPSTASLKLGSEGGDRLEITYEMLVGKQDPKQSFVERKDVEAALDLVRKQFAGGGVTDLTIAGCNVGKHQEFLNALGKRLGVKVHGYDTGFHMGSGSRDPDEARVGLGEGKSPDRWLAPFELPAPTSHSQPAQTAPAGGGQSAPPEEGDRQ